MEFHVEPGYEDVAKVLQQALDQSQSGKGKERHATVEPFDDQKIMHGSRLCGLAGMSYQVFKKAIEAQRQAEEGNFKGAYSNLKGAIVYAAAQYLRTVEMEEEATETETSHRFPYKQCMVEMEGTGFKLETVLPPFVCKRCERKLQERTAARDLLSGGYICQQCLQ